MVILSLLENKVDGVVIESPPYFHPEQAVAALQRGKHVYLAKPVAVDVPGRWPSSRRPTR